MAKAPKKDAIPAAEPAPGLLAPDSEKPQGHSSLGASGADRWLNCVGSVALINSIPPEYRDEDTEFSAEGTTAHEVGSTLLLEGLKDPAAQRDAWEVIGETFEGREVTAEMAEAVQVYLDTMRPIFGRIVPRSEVLIEAHLSSPSDHPSMYGTVDCSLLEDDPEGLILDVTDYKHGAGVFVSVVENAQIMYYGYMLLRTQSLPLDNLRIRFRIVQPRISGADPVREWMTTAAELLKWGEEVLLPGMRRTEWDTSLKAGDWCQFCEARSRCPLLAGLFAQAQAGTFENQMSTFFPQIAAVKKFIKAVEGEVYALLMRGVDVPSAKLVQGKANRVFKAGTEDIFKREFGVAAYEPAALKSPAAMEKIGPRAKELVQMHAYTPKGNLTVAPADDSRPAVAVQNMAQAFAHLTEGAEA